MRHLGSVAQLGPPHKVIGVGTGDGVVEKEIQCAFLRSSKVGLGNRRNKNKRQIIVMLGYWAGCMGGWGLKN